MPEEPHPFWKRVERRSRDECWPWLGTMMSNGYGELTLRQSRWVAHRLSFTLMRGDIPPGMTIDHLCRNRRCVNPHHLELVTLQENVLRGIGPTAVNARKTTCVRGHQFDGACRTHGKIYRYCKTCHREKMRRLNRQKKQMLTPSAGGVYA